MKLLDSHSKELKSFLLQLPYIPKDIIITFLKTMDISQSTLSLSTAYSLLECVMHLQPSLLEYLLESCIDDEMEIREKAVRLVKNKVCLHDKMKEKAENFASDMLKNINEIDNEHKIERYIQLYIALCTRNRTLLK